MDREAAARAIEAFLRAMDHDPHRDPQLAATAESVVAAWADEILQGYGVDVDALLSQNVFAGVSELVVVRDLPVATMCPHHLMPSSGKATVAFEPDEHLVGIGAIGRLVDAFARRLAMQEQIGEHVVAALQKHLAPRWAACRIVLSHACMTMRGARSHGATVETLAVSGGEVDPLVVYAALGSGARSSERSATGPNVDRDRRSRQEGDEPPGPPTAESSRGETLKLVGRLPKSSLAEGAMVRLEWPPFDVVVAMVDGVPCAIEDACNHAGASLSEGSRDGDCVACPMHGYVFELTTGRLVEPRGLCSDQRQLVARVEGDEVAVWDPGPPVAILGP